VAKKVTLTKTALISLVGLMAGLTGGYLVPKGIFDNSEKVVEVIDGDTFIIENRQPIRLFGIDAAEMGNCYSQEAKDELSRLILNKKIHLKEPLSDGRGRVMALVYQDGVLINEQLVRNGFAFYQHQGGSESENIQKANEYARENHIGIFGPTCYQKEPPDPKCVIKGDVNEREHRNKYYYPPGCRFYNNVIVEKYFGEDWFCSEKEAQKAGFTLAPGCQ